MKEGEEINGKRKGSKFDFTIPKDISEKIQYYGILETPRDTIRFWCSDYKVEGNVITVLDMLLDTSRTHKGSILEARRTYYSKVSVINYMATFFPYVPYKFREKEV